MLGFDTPDPSYSTKQAEMMVFFDCPRAAQKTDIASHITAKKGVGITMLKPSTSIQKRQLFTGTALGFAAFVTPVTSAYAQIDEVVVTARKTEENLQDVPVSVSAYTGDFFRESGFVEFADISEITPNFDVQEDGVQGALFSNLTIRGQSALNAQLNADQAVGIVINGAPITRGTNLFSNLFDVEQIEVLKGPQGTLFGKNTTGGTVIVRTTAPKLGEFSGYGEIDLGNHERRDFEAVVNIPLGDTLAIRLGGAHTNRDNFGTGIRVSSADDEVGVLTGRPFADDNEEFYRGSLLFQPNDRFSFRLNADYHEVDERPSIQRVLNDGILDLGFVVIPIAFSTPDTGDVFLSSDIQLSEPVLQAEEFNINGTIQYDFGHFQLESITSYREQDSNSTSNFAAAALIFNGQDSDLFAQELRFSGQSLDDRLQWQAGVFYSDEDGIDLDDVGGSGQITAVENQTIAGFVQGTYALTDRLNLTAGARYTSEDRAIAQIASNTEPLVPEVEANFNAFSWLGSLDYSVTDDILAYVSVSRGFRSGAIDDEALDNLVTLGTNGEPLAALEDIIIEPEFVTNYEVGLKGDFLDNTLRWNNSFFFSDYSNIQVQVFDSALVNPDTGVPILVLRNAAEATIWGFESEIQYSPTSDITLGSALGYTNAEFDEFLEPIIDPATGPTGLFDDRSDEAIGGPEWQFSAFGRYEFDVNPEIRGGVQINYSFRGDEQLAGPDVAAVLQPGQDVLDSYSNFNGQIDFDLEKWGLNVSLYARNIFDDERDVSGFALSVAGGIGLAQRITGSPREFGGRIRKSF